MVEITVIKNGRTMRVSEKQAAAFERAGIATRTGYLTRDMRAFPGTSDLRTVADVDAQIKADNAVIAEAPSEAVTDPVVGDDLDAMDIDALRAMADERGIKVHHRAGADKIRAALRGE